MPEQTTWLVVLLALVTGAPAILLAMARLIDVLKGNRFMRDLDSRLNGRMDQLLQERESRARIEGYEAGRAARRREDPPAGEPGHNSSLPPH